MRQLCFLLFVFSCVLSAQEGPKLFRGHGQAIVRLKPSAAEKGLRVRATTPSGLLLVTEKSAESLRSNPQVLEVEEVFEIRAQNAPAPNDPLFQRGFQAYLDSTKALPGISWVTARQSLRPVEGKAIVYVLDSGRPNKHEDINDAKIVWEQSGIDPAIEPDTVDHYGHGTFVLGIPGMELNNSKGGVGVEPEAMFGTCKVLDKDGSGTTFELISCLAQVTEHFKSLKKSVPGVRGIVIMSVGGYGHSNLLAETIRQATGEGLIPFASAGNNRVNVDRVNFVPCTIDGVICVGATDYTDQVAVGSNYGHKVAVMAPGLQIMGPVPVGNCTLCGLEGYRFLSGTSFAAPLAGGVAAMELLREPALTRQQLEIRIKSGDRVIKSRAIDFVGIQTPNEQTGSGSRLNASSVTREDKTPPSRPTLEIRAGHAFAEVTVSSNDPEGPLYGCKILSKEGADDRAMPNLANDGPVKILVPLTKGQKEITAQCYDKAGNASNASETLVLQAKEFNVLAVFATDDFLVIPGPAAEKVAKDLGVDYEPIWHKRQKGWHAGRIDELSYNGIIGDDVLLTPFMDLPSAAGMLSLVFDSFVSQLPAFDPADPKTVRDLLDQTEVWFLPEGATDLSEGKLIKRLVNSEGFGLNTVTLDVTEVAGQRGHFAFRFLATGSGRGIGWLLGKVEVRSDK